MTEQNDNKGWSPGADPLEIGMLVFPGFTLLDLAGPQGALGFHGRTHLISKTLDPVATDLGVSINPTTTFEGAPESLDVLFVPGGFGTNEVMKDQETLDFLAKAGASARYVTSVCTGSAILAMAGLLDGRRAATHWAFYEALAALGVEPCHDRVAVDGNRITGGGVTAGVDFGLTVIAALKGRDAAEFTQLALEYDPRPPFDAGHPRTARPEIVDMISGAQGIMGQMTPQAVEIVNARRRSLAAAANAAGAL